MKHTTVKSELQHIYKSNQCTDLNDVDYAISEVKRLLKKYGSVSSLQNRLSSLTKRRKQLIS